VLALLEEKPGAVRVFDGQGTQTNVVCRASTETDFLLYNYIHGQRSENMLIARARWLARGLTLCFKVAASVNNLAHLEITKDHVIV
jgi:hypothetical protein